MTDALAELESCQTLFLVGICEPFENSLQVLLQEAKTHEDKPQRTAISGVELGISYPIGPTEDARFFQLEWKSYIAYLVTNESFGKYPEEQFTGKNLRVFVESAYLHFLQKNYICH